MVGSISVCAPFFRITFFMVFNLSTGNYGSVSDFRDGMMGGWMVHDGLFYDGAKQRLL